MKNYPTFLTILVLTLMLFQSKLSQLEAQSLITLKAGGSMSQFSNIKYADPNYFGFTTAVGITYLMESKIFMNSEIGFLNKGTKGDIQFLDKTGPLGDVVKARLSNSYANLNTSVRYKLSENVDNNSMFYIGIGPKLDILLSSRDRTTPTTEFTSIYENYTVDQVAFGALGELGFYKQINPQLIMNLESRFFWDLKESVHTPLSSYKSNTLTLTAGLGYKLGQ